jgi:plastocyanin
MFLNSVLVNSTNLGGILPIAMLTYASNGNKNMSQSSNNSQTESSITTANITNSTTLSISKNFFPEKNTVNIVSGAALKRDKAFKPNPVYIKTNGTILWINEDTVTHTVTSGTGINDPKMGKYFDSGLLGKSFSFSFTKAGNYSYFCQVHPTMTGKIIVK